MPAIANVSRFEHVLGVANLARQVGFRHTLTQYDVLVLDGSAMLHDWAITAFGHLVEEALQYVGHAFDHEKRLSEILTGQGLEEINREDLQILLGRGTGIRGWAKKQVGQDADRLLRDIMEHIQGQGRMGRVIAGNIDLDNLDNVPRMAFHMGLQLDRELPKRIAARIVAVDGPAGEPVYAAEALTDVEAWLDVRAAVYQQLMLAERDFVGKIMMLYAAVCSSEAGEITAEDWKRVDYEFIMSLLKSRERVAREAVERWIAGELWDSIPPRWMAGSRPDYSALRVFSQTLTERIGRICFAYGIKDKRNRRLDLLLDNGSRRVFGQDANQWLIGIASPLKRPFSRAEIAATFDLAEDAFGASPVGVDAGEDKLQPILI